MWGGRDCDSVLRLPLLRFCRCTCGGSQTRGARAVCVCAQSGKSGCASNAVRRAAPARWRAARPMHARPQSAKRRVGAEATRYGATGGRDHGAASMVLRGHSLRVSNSSTGQNPAPVLGAPDAHSAARSQGEGNGEGSIRVLGDSSTPDRVVHTAAAMGRESPHVVRNGPGAQEGRGGAKARASSPDGRDSAEEPSRWRRLTRADATRESSPRHPGALVTQPWGGEQELLRASELTGSVVDEVATEAREVARDFVARLASAADQRRQGADVLGEDSDEWLEAQSSVRHAPRAAAPLRDSLSLSSSSAEGTKEAWAHGSSTGLAMSHDLQLTAPGLEDARALLRSWIAGQDTGAAGVDARHAGSGDGGAAALQDALPPLPHGTCASVPWSRRRRVSRPRGTGSVGDSVGEGPENAAQAAAPARQCPPESVGSGHSSDALPQHLMPASACSVHGGLAGESEEDEKVGESEEDEQVGAESRWQALYSRDAVRQSVSQGAAAHHLLPEPVARATEAWRRRAEGVAGDRASADVFAWTGRSAGVPPAARAGAGKGVEERHVLATLQMRHEMRAEQRKQSRALRHADPGPHAAPVARLPAAPRASRATQRTGERREDCSREDCSDEEAALRREIEIVRAQVAQQARALPRRRGAAPPDAPRELHSAAATGRRVGGCEVGMAFGGDELQELRQRRLGSQQRQETVADSLARQWSSRAARAGSHAPKPPQAPDLVPAHRQARVVAGPCSDGAASPAAASDQPWLAVAEDAAIAEDVCLDCRVCQEGRALSGDAAVACGRPLVEGQEWKEMLEGHVKGFSASFTSRLSDWNAKQDALQNAPHDTLEEDKPGPCSEGVPSLVVCAPPHQHPFRLGAQASRCNAQVAQDQTHMPAGIQAEGWGEVGEGPGAKGRDARCGERYPALQPALAWQEMEQDVFSSDHQTWRQHGSPREADSAADAASPYLSSCLATASDVVQKVLAQKVLAQRERAARKFQCCACSLCCFTHLSFPCRRRQRRH